MIFAQAFDMGRRHSKARVGDKGCWQEMEGWQLRAQVPAKWAFTAELREVSNAKSQPSPGAS